MEIDLSGQTAVVLASSDGLGLAAAAALAAAGAGVCLNGRDPDRLETAVETVAAASTAPVTGVAADISTREGIEQLFAVVETERGNIDHLITNAGAPPRRRFDAAGDAEWQAAYDLLVMSAVRAIRAARPLFSPAGGSITMITSRHTKEATPGNILSSVVRVGLEGLRQSLSRELAPQIRVNSVRPGPFTTARNPPETHATKAADIPMGELGAPGDLGTLIAYLSSPHAAYLTGASIPIDGGAGHSTL